MSDIITTLADADIELQKLIDAKDITPLTPESVKNFIRRLSLDAGNGQTTVLYSGVGTLPTSLTSDPNIRILDNTLASQYLSRAKEAQIDGIDNLFVDALSMLFNEPADLQRSGAGTAANLFVNGDTTNPRTTGLWDMISDALTRSTSPEVECIP